MPRKRAHVILPADLLAAVGDHGGGAFRSDLVRREIQRRKLLAALREARGSWKTEENTDLQEGSEAFVDRLRAENEARLKSLAEA